LPKFSLFRQGINPTKPLFPTTKPV